MTARAPFPPPYRDVTIGGLLTNLAAAIPNNEALVFAATGRRMTFASLEAEARIVARGLLALGVGRGDRVAVWATNLPEWIVLMFALGRIGAILVTVNTALRAREIDYLLRQSESSILVTINGHRGIDYIAELRQTGALDRRLPHLRHIIHLPRTVDDPCPEGLMPYARLAGMGAAVSEAELSARESEVGIDDIINMQYTSGTTGFPKGVMLSSRNIVNNGYWLGEGLGYTVTDRLCLCVPLFHCFGCVIGVLGAFTHGACLCPIESFDAWQTLNTIERERCTAVYGVPTMFLAELDDPEFHRFDLSSLRTGVMAGALCPEPLMRRAIDEMNLREMTIVYGLTEASPGITQTSRFDSIANRTQTVGQVLPEMEVRIIDPANGEMLPAGVPGELCVRGYNVMRGYYNNAAATAAAIDPEGWLRTGDQATIDGSGYVCITGRIKDLIIRGGENISPGEIEDRLRQHPAVSDASVYAIASRFFGEEVAASVRLRPGMEIDEEELREFCREGLARFKVPRHLRFVGDFPTTASGKIQKFRLREQHESELAD